MKLISVNDLSLQIEGYFAFKHVAFSLSQNEVIGINGDNGSGKTQLLEAIVNIKHLIAEQSTILQVLGSAICLRKIPR
ncbi:ATP-binding cassette domain-containing protein [Companilactobacillus pabuli]|uniref:ATP-binding cassette domain-containing protein n=1 Tax=Companilactobacillus pabuli TaxID=2714036 RepID=UPI0024171B5D|nr:ATP-binding cassette domain-containing protein [Companilactobacillus pabuli]MDG5112229.1 ATP-binding cassette domain-containing protein [Companilactobacillus pabuli]